VNATWDSVVRDVLDQARRAAGGGAPLALALRSANVGPESGTYSESAVSNWIKGRARPPADVLLAAASLYGISLDTRLGLEPSALSGEPNDLDELRTALHRLEALVHERLAPPAEDAAFSSRDVRAVVADRSEALAAMPVLRTLATSQRVEAMGLSLTALCQGVSDVTLAELVENGLVLRCLFLDPDGAATRARELEEGHPRGHLAKITRTNMLAIARLRENLSPEAAERVEVRTYDDPLRFNITRFDLTRALVQPYLPRVRGLDAPAFLIEADDTQPHGLFPVFDALFSQTWDRARVVED
jgi:transcriptional regulator with XRE-family HTH domain